MPSFLKKLDKGMDIVERNVVGYATLVMVGILFINVVLRNFFESGLVWGNELSSYLNILAVYIAISAGFKFGSHVGVSVVVDYVVPKKLRKAVSILTQMIILVFCGLVAYLAVRMTAAQLDSGQTSPVLSFPLWVIYGIVVVGMTMSSIRIVMEIIKILYQDNGDGGEAAC